MQHVVRLLHKKGLLVGFQTRTDSTKNCSEVIHAWITFGR